MNGWHEEPRLYHETQVAALCGQHCLNTLLQACVAPLLACCALITLPQTLL